jgi:hypothetical protein
VISNLLCEFADAMAGFVTHAVSQIVADPTTRSPS